MFCILEDFHIDPSSSFTMMGNPTGFVTPLNNFFAFQSHSEYLLLCLGSLNTVFNKNKKGKIEEMMRGGEDMGGEWRDRERKGRRERDGKWEEG